MEVSSFCVGRTKSISAGARDFQSRFNETFATRFRLEPKDGVLVAKVTAHSSGRLRLADAPSAMPPDRQWECSAAPPTSSAPSSRPHSS
jgi:hypothetical protein